jgi:acetyltransferase-like isoleucine patch superfamily enzyme
MKKVKYYFYRIMCNLTFGEARKYFQGKKQAACCGIGASPQYINVLGENNEYDASVLEAYKVRLTIKGSNNRIILENNCKINGNLEIIINGNNNKIKIGSDVKVWSSLYIALGIFNYDYVVNDAQIEIGKNTRLTEVNVSVLDDGTKLNIGEDCMFSYNIQLFLGDGHSVTDLDGNILNKNGNCIIGNHVWVGRNVFILKNAQIPDNSIVGAFALVAKKFTEPNTVIAGNPARVMKKGINWSGLHQSKYVKEVLK